MLPAAFLGPYGVLRGILHRPAAPNPAPGIVMLHGFTGNHVEDQFLYVQAARYLADQGFAVLRFDFFGSGDSDGTFDQFTVHTEVADAARAVEWLGQRPGVDPNRIGLIGLSLGGCVTALLAGQDPHVKAAVFWNAVCLPSLHFNDIAQSGANECITGGLRVGPDFLPTFYACDPLAAARRYQGPALVVQGTADVVVPVHESDALKLALGERGELHHIVGADHTFKHPDWRRDLFDLTARWLRDHLA
jgi:dipeptidyl aminopeptidase/acylaminoacyl peptidase